MLMKLTPGAKVFCAFSLGLLFFDKRKLAQKVVVKMLVKLNKTESYQLRLFDLIVFHSNQ